MIGRLWANPIHLMARGRVKIRHGKFGVDPGVFRPSTWCRESVYVMGDVSGWSGTVTRGPREPTWVRNHVGRCPREPFDLSRSTVWVENVTSA